MNVLWHNGAWKNEDTAVFTAHDRIRLGDGVFDTMPTLNGRLIHAEKHLARLKENAAVLGISFDLDFETIAQELIKRSGMDKGFAAINTVVSRGPGQRGIMPPEQPAIQIIMRASPAPETFPPIHAIIPETVRRNEGSPLSRIKSCNYGDNILALREAATKGANEAILLNNAGFVTCASSANIFALISGKLCTPPLSDGVLNGTARQVLMKQHKTFEKSLTPADLMEAGALFLTNCIRGAQAVEKLDGKTFPATLPLGIDKDFYIK